VADPNERIVGIDLGTSNTVVAYLDELDRVRLAPDANGVTVQPSVVSFHPNGGVVVGVAGKQRKVIDPKNTIYSAKRMIGQPFSSFAVQETARRVPFEIKQGSNEQAIVVTRTGEFAIPEISAIVLDHAKKLASAALGLEVGRAVVTVPASFTDVQRSSTATAGALAGLTVVRVLNEPTAAAIAYGNSKRLDEVIAVYDFGGGTFDITILKLEDQVYTVLGTSGDAFLGGEDIDERLVEKMCASFLAKHRIDLKQNEAALTRLRAVAEHTKIELSKRSRALVKIEEIAHGKQGKPIDLEVQLTRDELIGSIGDLVDRTFASCKEAMVLAGISQDKIRDVVLVGGTTRIPFVRERVAAFFGREPRADMNPEDAIATGAALQASSIERMLSRTPQRPVASVPIPLDDLEDEVPVTIEPEKSPTKIAEVKRPKRGSDMFSGQPRGRREPDDPAKTRERGKAFFGDLFGDTPVPTEVKPVPIEGKVATRPIARIKAPPKPVMPVLPPIVETRREIPAKNRTMALPLVTRPPAEPPRPPPTPPPPPELSMPTIDLASIEDDDFTHSEKSGELLIDVQPEVRAKRDSTSQFAIEIDPPTAPPRSEIAIDIEIDPPSVRPGLALEAEAFGIELIDPDVRPEPSAAMDLVMPPPRAPRPSAWDEVAPPAPAPRAATQPVPMMARSAPTIVDVTPRGLGIGTVAGFCEELIRRNSQLPVATRKQFATARDLQDVVRIVVCQGESRRLENNVIVGDLILENLPKRMRGETRIDVEFRLDASGILHVTARDVATGAEQRARLDLRGGMAPEAMSAAADRIAQLSRKATDE
jgi:molecular chaperone DnaK